MNKLLKLCIKIKISQKYTKREIFTNSSFAWFIEQNVQYTSLNLLNNYKLF